MNLSNFFNNQTYNKKSRGEIEA
uniref:Uncharacterized protein n=1 Tax=Strongyloides stercoralis TaxID=6248 RepID=A0A0K0EMT4_STRER